MVTLISSEEGIIRNTKVADLKYCFRVSCEYSMPEQSDMLYEEIEQWRDENHEDQTDDILVIGIRI